MEEERETERILVSFSLPYLVSITFLVILKAEGGGGLDWKHEGKISHEIL